MIDGLEQRRSALKTANAIRTGKRRIKERLAALDSRAAAEIAAAMLESPMTDPVGAFTVRELILSVPRLGDESLRRILRHAGLVNGARKLRTLTLRERRILAAVLRERQLIFPNTRLNRELDRSREDHWPQPFIDFADIA